jgi:pimeloyl-ACP methyl ester carboxylesterase
MSVRTRLVPAVIVPLAAAGLLLAGAPAALAEPGESPTWRYCPQPDAYRLHQCSDPPALPDGAAGTQLAWVLRQLAGGATSLTEAEVVAHYAPDYLTQVKPASGVLADFRQSLAELGTLTYQGMAFPPRTSQAVALAGTGTGERGGVGVSVDQDGRIESLQVHPTAATIAPHGPYSGLFEVHGRKMFLRCTGTGNPTVVFELGLTTDWRSIQDDLSATTRVCSYDPPNAEGPFSRSDPAPTPRTSADIVADLHTLLRTAGVPGPYVLAGFSNGGLNSVLYASTHPREVAALALIDGVHPDYYARRFAVLKPLLPPDVYEAFHDSSLALPPRLVDPAQFDIVTSQAQTRAALAAHRLRRLPLAVITHGIASPPPPSYPDWPVAADEALWTTLQNELAALEPGSRHVLAAGSDHDIPLNRPDLVLSTVRDLVAQVRGAG